MKKFWGAAVAFSIALISSGQYTIKGSVLHDQTNKPVAEASVSLESNGISIASQSTDNNGFYEFEGVRKKGPYHLTAEHVSFQKRTIDIDVQNEITTANVTLPAYSYYLEPLEVKSLRA